MSEWLSTWIGRLLKKAASKTARTKLEVFFSNLQRGMVFNG